MTAGYICQLSCDFCEGDEYSALVAGEAGVRIDRLREQAAEVGWTRLEVNGLRYDRCRECTEAGKLVPSS